MDNLILTGFMGCGKSTLSFQLSYRLKMPVVDTDKLIEREQGCTISDIFERNGEKAFREMETKLLEKLIATTHNTIIAVGGGTPLKEENRELLHRLGTVVYLEVNSATVLERLKGDTTRPLLQGEDAAEKVEQLLASRKGIYESLADITVDVNNRGLEAIMKEIEDRAV